MTAFAVQAGMGQSHSADAFLDNVFINISLASCRLDIKRRVIEPWPSRVNHPVQAFLQLPRHSSLKSDCE